MRRPTRVAMLVAAVLCAAATSAPVARAETASCATGESCVVVEVVGTDAAPLRTVRFTASQLAAFPDQEGGYYEVRLGPGSGQINAGVPIAELLTEAGVTPSAVTYAYVIGSTPYRSPLSSTTRDFDPPGTNEFVNGYQPIFYGIGGTTPNPDTVGYIRPLHDPNDTNSHDFLQVTHGGAFTVQVHLSGALLQPELTATSTTVRVGQAARLSASVADPLAQETLDWMWNLANGTKNVDTGVTPSLTTPPFKTPGTYYVQASVTGSSGSSGESNTVAITVKARSAVPTPKTTGPGRGAGTSKNPIGGPVTGSGSRYNGRPGAPPTATGGPVSPVSPVATGSPSASTTAASGSGSSTPQASASASASGRASAPRSSGGQLVVGFALVDPAGATVANPSVDAAPAAAAAARTGGQHVRASLAWVGVACILALLLAGAGLERRRATPGPKRRHR